MFLALLLGDFINFTFDRDQYKIETQHNFIIKTTTVKLAILLLYTKLKFTNTIGKRYLKKQVENQVDKLEILHKMIILAKTITYKKSCKQ